jgi:hypothetical protein
MKLRRYFHILWVTQNTSLFSPGVLITTALVSIHRFSSSIHSFSSHPLSNPDSLGFLGFLAQDWNVKHSHIVLVQALFSGGVSSIRISFGFTNPSLSFYCGLIVVLAWFGPSVFIRGWHTRIVHGVVRTYMSPLNRHRAHLWWTMRKNTKQEERRKSSCKSTNLTLMMSSMLTCRVSKRTKPTPSSRIESSATLGTSTQPS